MTERDPRMCPWTRWTDWRSGFRSTGPTWSMWVRQMRTIIDRLLLEDRWRRRWRSGGWLRFRPRDRAWSQRRAGAGVARPPGRPVEEPGGRWQLAQYLTADGRAGVGQGPRDRVGCAPEVIPAADGPGDLAELVLGHDLADERERFGLLVGEVTDHLRLQPGQQVAQPPRVRVHGERVVGQGLQGADQLVLVFHGIQQGLAVRVAGEFGPGLRPHGRALSGEVEAQLVAEHYPAGPGRRPAGRGVQQLVQVAAQRVVDRGHQRPVGPAVALDGLG